MKEIKKTSIQICLILSVTIFGLNERTNAQDTNPIGEMDKVSDIDNNEYKTVVIGKQLWMAENLKVTKYKNGDPIDNVSDNKKWIELSKGAWVNYDNDNKMYDNIYGKLYNWYVINDSRGVCPTGWHVPKITDWEILLKHLEKKSDPVGLSIIAGGYRSGENGGFLYSGDDSYFWIYDNNSIVYGWNRDMLPSGARMYRQVVLKTDGYSIRCIKDK